jgi:hypothetical protein
VNLFTPKPQNSKPEEACQKSTLQKKKRNEKKSLPNQRLTSHLIRYRLTTTNHMRLGSINQNLSCTPTRVVVARHRHAIRTGGQHG